MSALCSNDTFICIVCSSKTVILRLTDYKLRCIDHSEIPGFSQPNDKFNRLDNEETGLGLLCSDISPCGTRLAFTTLTKALCIVNLNKPEFPVESVSQLVRGASRIRFTPSSKHIIVADKSGDAYMFDAVLNGPGVLLLGHLSMLLDVLVSPDEKYIITCDRDEKIRVSSYPNSYNIISYCLGHSQFVSTIQFLPHKMDSLISTSGDGTIRVWDYKCGKQIVVCDTVTYVKSTGDQQIESEEERVIIDSKSVYSDVLSSMIVVCLSHFKMCMIFKCKSDFNELQIYTVGQIHFDASPWRITLNSDSSWVIFSHKDRPKVELKGMKLIPEMFLIGMHNFNVPEKISTAVNILNGTNLTFDNQNNIVNLLFKRKFDNVLEYHVKKEMRNVSMEPAIKKVKN